MTSLSRNAANSATIRFNHGIGTFSEALDAERAQFEAEDLLVERREKTATAMVAVFKTLGAGFGRSRKAQQDEKEDRDE